MESPLDTDPAVDDEILLDGQPDPLLAEWNRQHPLPTAAKAVDVSREPRDAHGRWTRLGGGHGRPGTAQGGSAARRGGGRRRGVVRFSEVDVQAPAGRDRYLAGLRANRRAGFITDPGEALAGKRAFLSEDGNCGVTVSGTGEVGNLFRNDGAQPGAGGDALDVAVAHGGRWLNCFDGALPGIYARHGFREVGRLRWDPGQEPAAWNRAKYDSPDVVFMAHGVGAQPGRYFTEWDAAEAAAAGTKALPRGGDVTTATARAKDVRAVHVLVELKALGDPEAEALADGLRRLIGTDDAELEARTEAAEAHVKAHGYTEALHPRDNHGRWARHAGGGAPSGGAKPSGGAPAAGGGHRVRKDRVAGTYAVIRPDGSVAASGLRHSEAQIRSAELNHPHGKVPETVAALAAGKHTVCAPAELPDVVAEIKRGGKPVNLSNLHVAGADHGNLFDFSATDLPRESMPVIPDDAASVADFAAHLGKKGMRARIERGVDPSTLHATQNQLDGVKVAGIQEWAKSDPAGFAEHYLVATNDGAVLDGHHRWAAGAIASLNPPPSVKMNVLRVDTDIQTLLDAGWEFDAERGIAAKPFGAKAMEELGQQQPQGDPPDPTKPYLWFDGQWILLASDTADGVPRKLDVPGKQVVNTKLDSESPN